MMLIQDTTQNTGLDKPLRISGDPMKVQVCVKLVDRISVDGTGSRIASARAAVGQSIQTATYFSCGLAILTLRSGCSLEDCDQRQPANSL